MTSRKPDDLESAPPLSEPDQGGTAPPTLEQLVRWRRDVRRFKSDPVPEALIDRLLRLADLAPSVGNSQPWRIVSVNSPEKRAAIVQNFEAARKRSAEAYSGDQADLYNRLKLAGFDAAPVHLAIFSDRGAMQGHSLGRQTMPETLDHSCACMVTVLWLAAREAGLGLGWVSILDPDAVVATLDVPADWKFVGYLLVGWPEEEHLDPELVRHGWQPRTAFETRYSELGSAGATPGQDTAELDSAASQKGSVTLVGAGPGDPELLTLKAVRALQSADAVLFDDLVAKPILDYVRPGAQMIDVGKRGYRKSCKQPAINAQMIALARQGLRVVRLKSGDPSGLRPGGRRNCRLPGCWRAIERRSGRHFGTRGRRQPQGRADEPRSRSPSAIHYGPRSARALARRHRLERSCRPRGDDRHLHAKTDARRIDGDCACARSRSEDTGACGR